MFSELETLRGASTDEAKSRRKALADQVTIELVRHSVAEEVLVHPQVEDKVSAEEAEHARKEHAEAEETLHRLEKLDADSPAFDDELATLMTEIRHHIEDEEGQMFGHMREVIDADELRKLGTRVEGFKKVAPTRPHPNVPNEPLPRMAAGPAASLFDRMRDLATGRGGGELGHCAAPLSAERLVAERLAAPEGSLLLRSSGGTALRGRAEIADATRAPRVDVLGGLPGAARRPSRCD
jgi:Hemerythrin HHE cation binding domain